MENKKLYQRRWFRITSITILTLFVGLLGIDLYMRSGAIPDCADPSANTTKIKCPFLAITQPSMKSRSDFIDDIENAGMEPAMAVFVATQITWQQKGLGAVLGGVAPDIYQLTDVHGISHCDLFGRYLPELKVMARKLEKEGLLTIQDLVTMKQWVAAQEGIAVIESSQIETSLAFLGAGGSLETGLVETNNFFAFMKGERLSAENGITIEALDQAQAMTHWD